MCSHSRTIPENQTTIMNRDGLLGRPRVGERLLPVETAALDKRLEPPSKSGP